MSKGSARRPRQVSQDEYASRWDEVFGRTSREVTLPRKLDDGTLVYEFPRASGDTDITLDFEPQYQ